MALWTFYFLAKLYLYFRGYIAFHFLPNAALFAAACALRRLSPPLQRRALGAVLGAAAVAVFWNDTYLPPMSASLKFMLDPSARPTAGYIGRFLAGYWNGFEASILAGLLLACLWAGRRKLNIAPLAAFLMLVPALGSLRQRASTGKASSLEAAFYAAESGRTVNFTTPRAQDRPFDIILLQVCSLSWDDLRAVSLEQDPFLAEFDVLISRFNTATSYSGPATVRLLRAACGQTSEAALFSSDAPQRCYLMENLKAAGYRPYSVYNHDGDYSNYNDVIVRWGKTPSQMKLGPLPLEARNFNGSAIYSNYETLTAWWKARELSGEPRAALYYNTVSLHDGARPLDEQSLDPKQRPQKYRQAARKMFDDLRRFFALVENSGRDALVVFVPEHGAALAGSRIQAQGLRDIPLPSLTTVPAGLRFISRGRRALPQKRLSQPLSYLALADMLAFSLRHRPDPNDPFPALALASLPQTPFMAENEFSRVIETGGEFLMQVKGKSWVLIP